MIFAIDFDGTCVEHKYPLVGETLPNCINVLTKLYKAGHLICLDTMRDYVNTGSNSKKSVMTDAIEWFESN